MKKIEILGKRYYVLTEEELRDHEGYPLYWLDSDAHVKIDIALFQFKGLIDHCPMPDWEKELRIDQYNKAIEGLYRGHSIVGP